MPGLSGGCPSALHDARPARWPLAERTGIPTLRDSNMAGKSSVNGHTNRKIIYKRIFFPKLDYQRVSGVNGDPILKLNRGPKCHFQLPPQIPPEPSLFPEGPPDLLRKFAEDHQTTSRQDGVVQGEGRILCGGTDQNNGATLAVQQESVLE